MSPSCASLGLCLLGPRPWASVNRAHGSKFCAPGLGAQNLQVSRVAFVRLDPGVRFVDFGDVRIVGALWPC